MFPPKRILVPTDFSDTAGAALSYATSLAETFGSELYVMHVLHDPLAVAHAVIDAQGLANLRERLAHDARQELEKLIPESQRRRFTARLVVTWGTPYVEIADHARREGADLIVMGTHGRGPLPSLLLGSVAQRTLHHALCPVLLVPPPGREPPALAPAASAVRERAGPDSYSQRLAPPMTAATVTVIRRALTMNEGQ